MCVVIQTGLSALREKVFFFSAQVSQSSPVPQLFLGPFQKLNKLTRKRLSSFQKQLPYFCKNSTFLQIYVQLYVFLPSKPFDRAISSQ